MKTKANRKAKSIDWFIKHECISDEWGVYPKHTKRWKKWVKYKNHVAINKLWYCFKYFDWNSYPVMHNCKVYSLVIFNEDEKECFHASFGSKNTKAQLKKHIDGYIDYKPKLKEIRRNGNGSKTVKIPAKTDNALGEYDRTPGNDKIEWETYKLEDM